VNNIDSKTVEGFGDEWTRFDQSSLSKHDLHQLFTRYFKIFPWTSLPKNSVGFDLGCGSGRWARIVADKVGKLHCIDASEAALAIAKKNLLEKDNCFLHMASVDNIPLEDNSMDFGYSLGVLHHVPDTFSGIKACVSKLKPSAPLLLYLYYAFDNRPFWFRLLWKSSNIFRQVISRLPHFFRYWVSQIIAVLVYYPLARCALILERMGVNVSAFPLSFYRHMSFYTIRTDALDRFGTRLEQRFTANEIREMMEKAGLERITFSDYSPYWCVVGYKRK
jgi:ubiquinone/menaquinone biosynthesis C-methylase UbiE